ncbi:hypothetical protein VTH06DRAFT_3969 [Thermothelomyces fergusii]
MPQLVTEQSGRPEGSSFIMWDALKIQIIFDGSIYLVRAREEDPGTMFMYLLQPCPETRVAAISATSLKASPL